MTLAALLLLSLAPQTVVEGVVSTAGGGPLAYARVQVVGDTLSDWTDERGFYRLEGLDRGEWRVRVTHPGHESLDLAVAVPGDRAVRLDVTLEPRPGPPVDALASFEPFRVEYTLPALLNEREMKDLMERRYPPDLARRGIGGEAVLLVWLDERGRVVRARVASSSGQSPLDSVALAVSDSMRFRPARIGSDSLRVIVRLPIRFTVPDSVPEEG